MDYYELKKLRRRLDAQKLRVATARGKAVSISSGLDGMPRGGAVSDRVGMNVGQIISEEEKLNALYEQLTEGIKSIPDEYIQTIVHCKIVKGWSWNRIAIEVGGGNSGEGIRKAVIRHSW